MCFGNWVFRPRPVGVESGTAGTTQQLSAMLDLESFGLGIT